MAKQTGEAVFSNLRVAYRYMHPPLRASEGAAEVKGERDQRALQETGAQKKLRHRGDGVFSHTEVEPVGASQGERGGLIRVLLFPWQQSQVPLLMNKTLTKGKEFFSSLQTFREAEKGFLVVFSSPPSSGFFHL